MDPNCKEVIDTGDRVVVDMGFFNVPPVREHYAKECDQGMVEMIQRQLGLTYEEALTKSLYHACRMIVRPGGRDGYFGWIYDMAEAWAERVPEGWEDEAS